MISGSNAIECECQSWYETAIQERIAIHNIANYHPTIRVDWIRNINNIVSRRRGLDRGRSVKWPHVGGHAKIHSYRT